MVKEGKSLFIHASVRLIRAVHYNMRRTWKEEKRATAIIVIAD